MRPRRSGGPRSLRGHDLSRAVRGDRTVTPETTFLIHIDKARSSGGPNHPAPTFRGVRDGRYTYAVGEIGRCFLYDNHDDPYQQHNLVDDPKRALT